MLEALERRTIPALNGIRAVAVGLVMLFHFGFPAVPGGHGVLIFFVLSGFLITWLLLREQRETASVSLRAFYARRAARILPASYAFVLLSIVGAAAVRRSVHWPQVACVIGYVANYYNAFHHEDQRNGVLSHLWSLSVEEQFYFIWPMAFLMLRRRPRAMVAALVAAIAAVWVRRWWVARAPDSTAYIYYAFDTRADHLLVGCLTAVLLRYGWLTPLWRTVTRRPWMAIVTWCLFTVSALYGNEHHAYRHAFGYCIEPVLAAIGIIQLVAFSGAFPWRWLDTKPAVWMGTLSYSLYLYQQIGVGPYVFPRLPFYPRLIACILVTFALAAGSYYLVERPFQRVKRRWTPGAQIDARVASATEPRA